jgi:acyl carrier protein
MTDDEIYAGLHKIFTAVFRRNDIAVRPELRASDVAGWDSFRYVSLILAAEEHFGIRLDERALDELQNVGDLALAIAAKTAETR